MTTAFHHRGHEFTVHKAGEGYIKIVLIRPVGEKEALYDEIDPFGYQKITWGFEAGSLEALKAGETVRGIAKIPVTAVDNGVQFDASQFWEAQAFASPWRTFMFGPTATTMLVYVSLDNVLDYYIRNKAVTPNFETQESLLHALNQRYINEGATPTTRKSPDGEIQAVIFHTPEDSHVSVP